MMPEWSFWFGQACSRRVFEQPPFLAPKYDLENYRFLIEEQVYYLSKLFSNLSVGHAERRRGTSLGPSGPFNEASEMPRLRSA